MGIAWYDIFGYIAALCIMAYTLPSTFDTIKNKDTTKLNITTFMFILIGSILFTIYGSAMIADESLAGIPIVIANGVSTLTSLFLCSYKINNLIMAKKLKVSEEDYCKITNDKKAVANGGK